MNSLLNCPTNLPPRPEVSAKIDARIMRRNAEPGSKESFTHASLCKKCRRWHVYVPSVRSARNIRKRMRKKEGL